MWCPTCQADVAAELSADHRRLCCARCRTELALSATEPSRGATRIGDAERSARDLLARWSAETFIAPPPTPDAIPLPTPLAADGASIESTQKPERAAEADDSAMTPTVAFAPVDRRRTRRIKRDRLRGSASDFTDPPRSMPWMATVGQLVAYAGVGGLTCGAVLVLWSHFGGPAHYAPTGWLLTTIGQMLLFLGVVTLVAGSLERITADFDRRWKQMSEQLDALSARPRRRRRLPPQDEAA
jgi:hypothetical protein